MKNKKILKAVYLVVIVLAIFKLFKLNISNYEQFYQISNYDIKKRQLNKIEWKDIGKKDGVYLLTSKGCPYCLRYISRGIDIVKKESEEHDLSKNIVDLDIDEYFNNADLNKILEYYSINTIPCILEIKNNEVKLIEFEEIKKY
ncbi:hypothetical protein ABDJ34_04980 [Finegoldia dalianensis]|uniref:Glutaredoxin domain-containing protein n=1 Tax=Finegoldia dalianensis TaxID=3145239 RepID=A0ABW9KD15_9FIRM